MCSKEHNAQEDLIPLSPDEEEAAALLKVALAQQQVKRAAKKQKITNEGPPVAAPQSGSVQEKEVSKTPEADAKKDLPRQVSAGIILERGAGTVPPTKRLRDWVLESEATSLITKAESQLAA